MRAIAFLLASFVLAGAARADALGDKVALCTACHGTRGVPVDKSVPAIAGQMEGYLYLELRDFKLGNRHSDMMQPIAATLDKADMQGLAHYFATQPWPDLQQKRAAGAVAHQAEVVAGAAGCAGCHGQGFAGASVTPRLAGQGADYLRTTMLAFKSGARANNPWMSALLKTYSDQDIAALAQFLAGL